MRYCIYAPKYLQLAIMIITTSPISHVATSSKVACGNDWPRHCTHNGAGSFGVPGHPFHLLRALQGVMLICPPSPQLEARVGSLGIICSATITAVRFFFGNYWEVQLFKTYLLWKVYHKIHVHLFHLIPVHFLCQNVWKTNLKCILRRIT